MHDSLPVTGRGAWQLVVLQGGLLVLVLVDAWSPRCEELRPGWGRGSAGVGHRGAASLGRKGAACCTALILCAALELLMYGPDNWGNK